MKRNIYISETPLESRIAIMEDKQLVELKPRKTFPLLEIFILQL